MLQRTQTLFLLGVFILSLLLLTGPFARYTLEGSDFVLKHSGLFDADGMRMDFITWPLSTILISVAILTFLNIFFYRNRMLQMRMAIFLILMDLGMLGMMFFYTSLAKSQMEGALVLHQWRFLIPPISMILLYFAFRRIRRDELLVKAFDRIR
jgi:glucan phosphoethanolaminetransferase (alkaline phosphatase superfamily)